MKMQAVITGGKVHDVGYRVFLLQRGLGLGFQKFSARNRVQGGAEQVVVQYEGDSGQVDALNSIIREEHPPDANVSDIVFEQYEGYVISTIDYMHMIQIEQLAKGIPAILSIDKKQDKMLEKMDCMLEKQDNMLEKQDNMLEKQDNMLEKMDQMEGSITNEIRDLRTDMCSHFDRRLSTMEADIQQIKAKIGLI